jgi:protein gp37
VLDSKISWCHISWNPWTGCNKIGPECEPCYIFPISERAGRDPNILALTQTWRDPYRMNRIAAQRGCEAICFTCSMSDFFHQGADLWRPAAWRTIKETPNLNYMLLTKRPERILKCLPPDYDDGKGYPNVWLGVTCGVRSSYPRVDILRDLPCAVRFLSVEPLMGSVSDIDLTGIGWVAVGGCSGPTYKNHPMRMEWAAEVHDLCRAQGIPFLFKQDHNIYTERGINALSIYLAERDGIEVDPATVPLIREYPATGRPLLPFVEHGKRYTMAQYAARDWVQADDLIQIQVQLGVADAEAARRGGAGLHIVHRARPSA